MSTNIFCPLIMKNLTDQSARVFFPLSWKQEKSRWNLWLQVLTPSSGFLDFAISMRPDYHRAIIDTVRHYGWKKIIYLYDSHDGESLYPLGMHFSFYSSSPTASPLTFTLNIFLCVLISSALYFLGSFFLILFSSPQVSLHRLAKSPVVFLYPSGGLQWPTFHPPGSILATYTVWHT